MLEDRQFSYLKILNYVFECNDFSLIIPNIFHVMHNIIIYLASKILLVDVTGVSNW